ncbi:MAG: hypothetical protein EOP42_18965 [Sphingobacteriaceae bacterium]|nr:MAG: hypothetical protein EOP42_18965 [Sphingobacteriaceae bacterium]
MNWAIISSNIFQGIVSGIIASGIFLIIISSLKPKIVISDKIASQYLKIRGKDIHVYFFKIINKSLFFRIYDLKVNAYVCDNIPNINGNDTKYSDITLKGGDQWVLNKLNFRHLLQNFLRGEKTLESRSDYAAQFTSFENLENLIKKNSYIVIQVLAKHSLTGFSSIQTMKYQHNSKIEKGCFLSGNSCRIVKAPEINKTIGS